MVSGHMADVEIERLTQRTALTNALMMQKLDNDLPEIGLHPVTEATHPWDLKEIPCMSIIAFTPKPELKVPALVCAGAEVASIPALETECRFRTCFDVTVHPMTLLSASFLQPPGEAPSVRLQCRIERRRPFQPGKQPRCASIWATTTRLPATCTCC